MPNQLADKEILKLADQFRILEKIGTEESVPLTRLLDEKFLKAYLLRLKSELGADSMLAVGSLFMKRLGYLLVVPAFYTLTRFNKKLNFCLSNCFLISRKQNGKWMPYLYLQDTTAEMMGETNREKELVEYASGIFSNIRTILGTISTVASVPRPLLWENIAIYVYWLYETRLITEGDEEAEKRRKEDFHVLLYGLPTAGFVESYHPLQHFFHNKSNNPLYPNPVRTRRTCCFYYQVTEDGGFCKTCPKRKRKNTD